LNNSFSSLRPEDSARVTGLSRLVRQICLLREQGDSAGATRLQENDLATAVTEVRRVHGADALRDAEVDALFATETRRVTEASLTAELLINRLAELWSPLPVVARSGPAAGAARESVPARPIPAGPPVISDLLDAMLAAERPSTRSTPTR